MSQPKQRGVVLIVVLWVIALLTLLLAAFTQVVKTDRQAASSVLLSVQTKAAADAVLHYLAAMNAVPAPELDAMLGQSYSLWLDEQEVRFRVVPEAEFVPVNKLSFEQWYALLAYMRVADAEAKAQYLFDLSKGVEAQEAAEAVQPVSVLSVEHLAGLLALNVEDLRAFARWFSFVGQHTELAAGYVPEAMLAAVMGPEQAEASEAVERHWQPAALYRVQVEVNATRQVEAVAAFEGAKYRLLLFDEYNADFHLNDVSE